MLPNSIDTRFYEFADSGAEPEGSYRWFLTVEINGYHFWELCSGQVIEKWDPQNSLIAQCPAPEPTEDMPWAGLSPHIVSDRLRRLLENHAHGCAQYLPVRMMYQGQDLDLPPYWAANWLNVEDCIDWKRSLYKPDHLTPGEFSFYLLVIDPALIRSPIVRVHKYMVTTLISADLRKRLEDHGITGCQYYDIWHSGDDLPKIDFDPNEFRCYDDRFVSELLPAARIDRVHEFVGKEFHIIKKVHMPETRYYRGTLPPQDLRRVILNLGNRVGVDWRGERAEAFCALFEEADLKATGTYKVYIELAGKRDDIMFHFYVHEPDEIRFGFWGPEEFIAMVKAACEISSDSG